MYRGEWRGADGGGNTDLEDEEKVDVKGEVRPSQKQMSGFHVHT